MQVPLEIPERTATSVKAVMACRMDTGSIGRLGVSLLVEAGNVWPMKYVDRAICLVADNKTLLLSVF